MRWSVWDAENLLTKKTNRLLMITWETNGTKNVCRKKPTDQ
ncbi:hypothetical protein ACFQO8_03765 [Exiguobacterium aestuarii]|uniref:Uncharacterized protein n=1 Tax=Exiguobacterium aestuarii TaxID=273527 RepID=A0ABW2PIF1_9BACL|nr:MULTISPECIES: hypothetical protein [Exiguobacterium]MCT4786598.1 hypothetical protein [Exiguobacterium aestuarii]